MYCLSDYFKSFVWSFLFLFCFNGSLCAQVTNTSSVGTWGTAGDWDNGVPADVGTSTVNHALEMDQDIVIEGLCTVNSPLTDAAGGSAYSFDVKSSGVFLVNADVTAESTLNLSNTASITVKGCNTLTVGATTISNNTTFIIEACAELVINGDLVIENHTGITCNGQITVNGNVEAKNNSSIAGIGSLVSTGTVDINNSATIFGSTSDCGTGPCSYGASPLPIELVSFEAHIDVDHVDIKWVTATETNNDYFVVERSTDGKHFKEVLWADGAGNSSTLLEYFDIDFEPVKGVSYYRLKQVDFDGNYSYSNIEPVEYHVDQHTEMLIFPNPASSINEVQVKLDGLKDHDVLVVVRDMNGRELHSKIHLISTHSQLIGFDVEHHIPPGQYLITASSENVLYSRRLIITE